MKRICILALCCALQSTVFATEGIRFESLKWAEIKAKAAREHKMIFLDAFASWCGPCKYMEEHIYSDEKTASYYNSNFINVKIDMEEGEGPALSEEYGVTAYPTFLFFDASGKLVHKYVGAMEAGQFIDLGKDAKSPDKQYYTLKEKASKLELTDEAFLRWAEMANGLDDEGTEVIINRFLAAKTNPLVNKEVATVFIQYSKLTDEQLAMLYRNKARVKTVMDWDGEKTEEELYRLLFSKAAKAYNTKGNSVDAFMEVIQRFDPSVTEHARKDVNYRIMVLVKKDFKAAMEQLIGYLKDTKNPESIKYIGRWMADYADEFDEEDMNNLETALSAFNLRSIDKGSEYWLDLMRMLAQSKLGNEARAKEFAEKAYKHPGIPKAFKEILVETYKVGE